MQNVFTFYTASRTLIVIPADNLEEAKEIFARDNPNDKIKSITSNNGIEEI